MTKKVSYGIIKTILLPLKNTIMFLREDSEKVKYKNYKNMTQHEQTGRLMLL